MKNNICICVFLSLLLSSCYQDDEITSNKIDKIDDMAEAEDEYGKLPEFYVSINSIAPYSEIQEYAKERIAYLEYDLMYDYNLWELYKRDFNQFIMILDNLKNSEELPYDEDSKDILYEECNDVILSYLNSHPVVEQVIEYAQEKNGSYDVYIDIDASSFDIVIADKIINKMDLLYKYERGMPLNYLLVEDTDDYDNRYDADCHPYKAPRQKAIRYTAHLKWGDNIRYRIADNINSDEESEIESAMLKWEKAANNNFKFKQIENGGLNKFSWGIGCNYHILIMSTDNPDIGGFSTLGCVPWATIKISDFYGRAPLHELGHTLGLLHEHQRPDRDCHVQINWDNIKCGYASNFWKLNISKSYGDFDYESVMIYSSDAFGDGSITIDKVNWKGDVWTDVDFPQSLSSGDIEGIRSIYN